MNLLSHNYSDVQLAKDTYSALSSAQTSITDPRRVVIAMGCLTFALCRELDVNPAELLEQARSITTNKHTGETDATFNALSDYINGEITSKLGA